MNALLSSRIVVMDRSNASCVKILVQTPSGMKLTWVEKRVSTIPPAPSILRGYDLDGTDQPIFRRFWYHSYYGGVLNHFSVPGNFSLTNVRTNILYILPVLPAAYGIPPTRCARSSSLSGGCARPPSPKQPKVDADIVASIDRV